MRRTLLALLVVCVPATAHAHDLSAALLDVHELDAGGRADVTVKTSLSAEGDGAGPAIEAVLPATCRAVTPPARAAVPFGLATRWQVVCDGGLRGQSIAVRSPIDVLARVHLADGTTITGVLRPGAPALAIPTTGAAPALLGWIRLGIRHILFGADHLLFVLGLVLLARPRRQLLRTITAFTLGHSVTLSLAVLGVVRFPAAPLEAAIAASILLLAVELARPTPAARHPARFAALFGLLHGFGFAGALTTLGLSPADIPQALFGFNVGVELGQLAFVAVLLLLLAAVPRLPTRRLVPYAIGSLAACWCWLRIAAFWAPGGS